MDEATKGNLARYLQKQLHEGCHFQGYAFSVGDVLDYMNDFLKLKN